MCVKCCCESSWGVFRKNIRIFGNMRTLQTANYCKIFDSYFECLKVRSVSEHVRQRKPFLAPFTTENNEHFDWLKNQFLKSFFLIGSKVFWRYLKVLRKRQEPKCLSLGKPLKDLHYCLFNSCCS